MELKLESGMLVALDTAPLIYLIEKHDVYSVPVRRLLDQCSALGISLVSSMITYIDVLTHPERLGQPELAARYRAFLTNARNFSLHPLNVQVADVSIRYRAKYGFKTPDAIQLAVAHVCGATYFVTNDNDLKRCNDVRVVLVTELPHSSGPNAGGSGNSI